MYSRCCRSIIILLYNNIKRIDLDVFTTVYTYIHTNTYVHICIHTYTYAYTYTCVHITEIKPDFNCRNYSYDTLCIATVNQMVLVCSMVVTRVLDLTELTG